MIESYRGHSPCIADDAFVHQTAVLIGEVSLASQVSIWPHVVLRGDQGAITIGAQSNVQDGSVVHCTGGLSTTRVGPRVTVGHNVVLHGCNVEADCLIGMGAILMDNCHIEPWCVIAAGALVPMGRRIPAGSLVAGSPGRVVRKLSDDELEKWIRHGCEEYLRLGTEYRKNT
jgi:carbonic anhydrase/acetyltransferase-like protein (isoleucine patch superfamily)